MKKKEGGLGEFIFPSLLACLTETVGHSSQTR